MKKEFPDLPISINVGIGSLEEAQAHFDFVDGVMIGRAAYQNPYLLAQADTKIFGATTNVPRRFDVMEGFFPYIERELAKGTPLHAMTRHILGLFQGVAGARAFRRILSEQAWRKGAGIEVLHAALEHVARAEERQEETAFLQSA